MKIDDEVLVTWMNQAYSNYKSYDSCQGFIDQCKYSKIVSQVLITGAGSTLESLERKQISSNMLVIANQSTLGPLLAKSIEPDIMMIADAGIGISQRLLKVYDKYKNIDTLAWILPTHVHPSVLALIPVQQKIYWYHAIVQGDDVWNTALNFIWGGNKVPYLMQMGSVCVMAMAFVESLIKSISVPIYLSGVDFGYPDWPKQRIDGEEEVTLDKSTISEDMQLRSSAVQDVYYEQFLFCKSMMKRQIYTTTEKGRLWKVLKVMKL